MLVGALLHRGLDRAPRTELIDTDPDSPANDNNPEVKGSAEAGSTVKIYSTVDCSGEPLGTGTAAAFSSLGITVSVPADQATDLRARALDAAGNPSGCSSALSYVEDSTPPDSVLTEQPPEKTTKRRVKLAFSSSEPGSTFRCSLDGNVLKPCDSPWEKRVELGAHVFRVDALDPSGNADPTPAKAKFKVIHSAPRAAGERSEGFGPKDSALATAPQTHGLPSLALIASTRVTVANLLRSGR